MKALFSLFFFFFFVFVSTTRAQNRTVLFVLVNEADANVTCTEGDLFGTAFFDSRNLAGWLDASSYGEISLSPPNQGFFFATTSPPATTAINVTTAPPTTTSQPPLPPGSSAVASIFGFEANGTTCDLDLLREWSPRIFNATLEAHPYLPDRPDGFFGTVPDFDHVVLVFPSPSAISSAGGPSGCPAFEGESPTLPLSGPEDYEWLSWVFECDAPVMYARGLGLNFGFFRKSPNDTADVMEGSSTALDRTPNAPNRVSALWLRPDEGLFLEPDFNELFAGANFSLPDLALVPVDNATVALQIRNLTEDAWLYVSCRANETNAVFYDDGNGVSGATTVLHVHHRPFGDSTVEIVADVFPGDFFFTADDENSLLLAIARDFTEESCDFEVLVEGLEFVSGTVGHVVFENSSFFAAVTLFAENGTLDERAVIGIGAEERRDVPGTFGSFVLSPTPRPPELDPAPLGERNFSVSVGAFTSEEVPINGSTVLVDDDDSGASSAGPWNLSLTSPSGFFGSGYSLSVPGTDGNFTFEYPFAERRLCQVLFYWTSQGNESASNVEVQIFHLHPSSTQSATNDSVFLNQGSGFPGPQNGSHVFATLGAFHMVPSPPSKVVVFSENGTAPTSVDAVEFACDAPWDPSGSLPLGGNKKILVIPVDPDGSGTPPPCDPFTAASGAANVTRFDSFDRVDFAVVVAPSVNLSFAALDLSGCDYQLWAELALNATTPLISTVPSSSTSTIPTTSTSTNNATTAPPPTTSVPVPPPQTILGNTTFLTAPPYFGLEVPDFDVLLILLPAGVGGCQWDLFSAIGHPVQVSTACDRTDDLVHALGHAFGLGRSANESSAATSPIGSGGAHNAPQRSAAGWLTPDRVLVPEIENSTILLALLDDSPAVQTWAAGDPPLAVQLLDAEGTPLFVSCRGDGFHVHEFAAEGFPAFPPSPGRGFNFASLLTEVFVPSVLVQKLTSEGDAVALGFEAKFVAANVSNCTARLSVPFLNLTFTFASSTSTVPTAVTLPPTTAPTTSPPTTLPPTTAPVTLPPTTAPTTLPPTTAPVTLPPTTAPPTLFPTAAPTLPATGISALPTGPPILTLPPTAAPVTLPPTTLPPTTAPVTVSSTSTSKSSTSESSTSFSTTTITTTTTTTTTVVPAPRAAEVPLFVWILIPATLCGLLCVVTVFLFFRVSGLRRRERRGALLPTSRGATRRGRR